MIKTTKHQLSETLVIFCRTPSVYKYLVHVNPTTNGPTNLTFNTYLTLCPKSTLNLWRHVNYPRTNRPILQVHGMHDKICRENGMGVVFVDPLGAGIHGRIRPIASGGAYQCRKKVPIPVAKCLPQVRNWTQFNVGAVWYVDLSRCWPVQLWDFQVVFL